MKIFPVDVAMFCTGGWGKNIEDNISCAQICARDHTVCWYSLLFSEQTAIISLYSNNWLVCVTEAKSVHHAVGRGYLNILHLHFSL